MELKDLAPWIAIAFTLALSILVPLFTQIANNSHQRKMQRERFEYEEKQKRIQTFKSFLSEVGGTIITKGHIEQEALFQAGGTLHELYVYVPTEWYDDLDKLSGFIMTYSWNEAKIIVQKFSRLISEELSKQ